MRIQIEDEDMVEINAVLDKLIKDKIDKVEIENNDKLRKFDAYEETVKELEETVKELEDENEKLSNKLEKAHQQIENLELLLARRDKVPAYVPPYYPDYPEYPYPGYPYPKSLLYDPDGD